MAVSTASVMTLMTLSPTIGMGEASPPPGPAHATLALLRERFAHTGRRTPLLRSYTARTDREYPLGTIHANSPRGAGRRAG